jgi:hypothetical protein
MSRCASHSTGQWSVSSVPFSISLYAMAGNLQCWRLNARFRNLLPTPRESHYLNDAYPPSRAVFRTLARIFQAHLKTSSMSTVAMAGINNQFASLIISSTRSHLIRNGSLMSCRFDATSPPLPHRTALIQQSLSNSRQEFYI